MRLQKRWDRRYDQGYAEGYLVDIEKPIHIFDCHENRIVKYTDLSFDDRNMIDTAVDIFEEGFNKVTRFGSLYYEQLNYNRFSLLREIKEFGETVYQINDFNEE